VRRNDARAGTRIRGSAAGVAAFIFVAACGHKGAPPAFPPPEVSVVEIRPGTVAQSYEFTGQVVSYRRVEVRARVDGIILERPFVEGTVVHAGQLLYRLDGPCSTWARG
jgi:membrane fusion protein (multidrug efflux system)